MSDNKRKSVVLVNRVLFKCFQKYENFLVSQFFDAHKDISYEACVEIFSKCGPILGVFIDCDYIFNNCNNVDELIEFLENLMQ